MRSILLSFFALFILFSCEQTVDQADMVLVNATVYTANDHQPRAEAVAIKNKKIVRVGTQTEVEELIGDSTRVIDLTGRYIYPGFIEGHAHIMGMGSNLINVDLREAKSYEEAIQMVQARAAATPEGTWILGRGWHQDKWEQTPERMFRGFPTHHQLSEAVPNHPVWLKHASGHAGLANAAAMEMAGITRSKNDPDGGEIFRDVTGNPTGIFNERAQQLITDKTPKDDQELLARQLELAIQECVENGITSFHEARSDSSHISVYEQFAKEGKLKIRLYVMLNGRYPSLLATYFEKGPQIDLYDEHLTIRSIKLYADGALGSRGAWLLEEYSDAEGNFGHNLTSMEEIEDLTNQALENGFQVCTHAIGDRANREVLDIYQEAFERNPAISKDHRFRIEHAQHIHPDDIPRFAELGVLPAMQAIHMSSDRPWAIDRLGKERIENGAYMWSDLIDSGSRVINGTDAPVEPVSALASFYASVSRKTLAGMPEGGFEPAQKMTREEALKSYTLWPAYGAFMEDRQGSIEPEKFADFTILDQDIMTIPEDDILKTNVVMTIIDGDIVFEQED